MSLVYKFLPFIRVQKLPKAWYKGTAFWQFHALGLLWLSSLTLSRWGPHFLSVYHAHTTEFSFSSSDLLLASLHPLLLFPHFSRLIPVQYHNVRILQNDILFARDPVVSHVSFPYRRGGLIAALYISTYSQWLL